MMTAPVQHAGDAEQLRERVRARLGLGGTDEREVPSLRSVFASNDCRWYPLVALGLLAIVDTFQRFGFSVLTPEISRSLGVSKGQIASVIAVQTVAIALTPVWVAMLVQHRARRAALSIAFAVVWSVFLIGTGFIISIWGLAVVLLAGSFGHASTHALHPPLLLDSYPPAGRVRVLTTYQSFDSFGNVLAPLLVAGGTVLLSLTWRGVFVVLGVLSLIACCAALRLRDPGFGRFDEQVIRAEVRSAEGVAIAPRNAQPDNRLGFFETARRLMLIPTVRRLLIGYAMLGVLLVPYQTFLFFFLDERWNMGPGARGVFFAVAAAASVISLNVFGRRAERAFRRRPESVVRLAAGILTVGVLLICLGGVAPWFWAMVSLFAAAQAVLALLRPAIAPALLGVVASSMRPHVAALTGIFVGGVGGTFGALFLTGIESRFGVGAAMVSLLVPGLVAAVVIGTAAKLVPADLDRMIDRIVEDEQVRLARARGAPVPLLACRNIDVSYGQLQVLFGVDFQVDEGEMVALLGVNGAGKSTLLKAMSGLCLPSAGSVRLSGEDITFLDAERRVRLGIAQVPGGQAVFGPLTVVDNLRGMGYSLGRDRHQLDAAIDRCFETFPSLAARRNLPASSLSGGEQQMLGLSKALILRPRVLLIDELSLGLAPVVVGQLLELVREINADGTSVVLVEQSVNIALNLVHHAYFMEKGEIRFDGTSHDLLERDDLLRAVFLDSGSTFESAGA